MQKKLIATVKTPREAFGSKNYIVTLSITNLTSKDITIVSADIQTVLGKKISKNDLIERDDSDISDYDQLNAKKSLIISDLQGIAHKAYNKSIDGYRRYKALYKQDDYLENDDIKQILKIDDLRDVKRLQERFFSDDSNPELQKYFNLGTEKLKEVLAQQEQIDHQKSEKGEGINLKTKYVIKPGATISFPFEAIAPFLLQAEHFTFQFKISYQDPYSNTLSNFSVSEDFTFYPSIAAIYIGAAIGGIIGAMIKTASILPPFNNLIESFLLALVFTAFTVRTPTSKKVITTEDFIGGFILGALTGFASPMILNYLLKFVPS